MVLKKKSSVVIYFVFLITVLVIIVITAVFAPMGVLINSELYQAGEDIMLEANESINNIDDASVRASVLATVDAGFDAQQNNIEVNANLFQYGWIFVIILSGIVVFLFTRRIVEIQQGGIV